MSKAVRSVSFNANNEQDKECLEHIEGINFSGYVKDLIYSDLLRRRMEKRVIKRKVNGGLKIEVLP